MSSAQKADINAKQQKEPTVLPSHDADCHNGGIQCGVNEECVRGSARDFHVSEFSRS